MELLLTVDVNRINKLHQLGAVINVKQVRDDAQNILTVENAYTQGLYVWYPIICGNVKIWLTSDLSVYLSCYIHGSTTITHWHSLTTGSKTNFTVQSLTPWLTDTLPLLPTDSMSHNTITSLTMTQWQSHYWLWLTTVSTLTMTHHTFSTLTMAHHTVSNIVLITKLWLTALSNYWLWLTDSLITD